MYYIETTQSGIIKGLDQESLSIYLYNSKAINNSINGYLSSNPTHPTKNKQYSIGLTVLEYISTVWIETTSVIYVFFNRFHYHSFVLCFFFYFLSPGIHYAHNIITSVIIYKTDTHKTDTTQENFYIFFR